MIGTKWNGFKAGVSNVCARMQSSSTYDLGAANKVDPTGLPVAPRSAFRKRPVKLEYDANEYHQFRLPSENDFLFSGMDKDDIFGYRKGLQHSPFMQAQQNLDSNLLWAITIGSVFMMGYAIKQKARMQTLRENYRNADMGRFDEDSFK
jgi:hypothetical protein